PVFRRGYRPSQNVGGEAGVKSSQFNLVTTYEETAETLIFNTATGGLVAFPDRLGVEAKAVLDGTLAPDHASPMVIEALDANRFRVPDGVDEVEQVLARIGLGIEDGNRLDVFVLPNMNCNFACPYCYEDHHASQMSDEVEA